LVIAVELATSLVMDPVPVPYSEIDAALMEGSGNIVVPRSPHHGFYSQTGIVLYCLGTRRDLKLHQYTVLTEMYL
jgi:hypothetical protein